MSSLSPTRRELRRQRHLSGLVKTRERGVVPDARVARYEMHRHGLTVRSWAEAAGVNPETVNQVLQGRPVEVKSLAKLARALKRTKVVDGGLAQKPAQIEQE